MNITYRRACVTKMVLVLALLGAALSISRATLIDQTPGGFHEGITPTPAFDQFIERQTYGELLFFDSTWALPYTLPDGMHPPGWVSQFGVLKGGTYFLSNLGQTGPVTNSTLSWNFTGTDFWLQEIYVWGRVSANSSLTNLYTVPWDDRFISDGSVALDGNVRIDQIAFYGTDPSHVPDTGKTVILFAVPFAVLVAANLRLKK